MPPPCLPHGYRVPSHASGPRSSGPCSAERRAECTSAACESARVLAETLCAKCGDVLGYDRSLVFRRLGGDRMLVAISHEGC